MKRCEGDWLPTPFASFPFTSPPVRHRVPSRFNWTLQYGSFLLSPDCWPSGTHGWYTYCNPGRRPFCSAQTTQSIVKDKLPVKARCFRLRSEVWGSRDGRRFMGSDATQSGRLVATFQINLPHPTLEATSYPEKSVRTKYIPRRFIPRRQQSNAKPRKASGAWRLFRFPSLPRAAFSRDVSESPDYLCARAAVHSAVKEGRRL